MDCTIDTCPVSASIYGYRPSLPANAFFVAFFGGAAIVQTVQGIKYRTWTFMVAMALGSLCEAVGYAGRIMLRNDPFGDIGFDLQICLLTVAPAFLAAGIYLMLKHLVIAFGTSFSRLPAAWYTYIFITCDFISLVLQGSGGGIAATADDSISQLDVGDNLMMTGLSFQVFTLLIFAVLSGEYALRVWKRRGDGFNHKTRELRRTRRFRCFVAGLVVAFFAILVRCIYRIAEMAGGWRNAIMQNEPSFIALDSTLCTLAVLVLTVLHPGYCFNYRVVNQDELRRDGAERGKSNVLFDMSDADVMSRA